MAGENPAHRISKVSPATIVDGGLGGPKLEIAMDRRLIFRLFQGDYCICDAQKRSYINLVMLYIFDFVTGKAVHHYPWKPYRKPTQVDEARSLRCASEPSLRNSAKKRL